MEDVKSNNEDATQKTRRLEKDLKAIRKAHPPVHHYRDQPTIAQLREERKNRRWEVIWHIVDMVLIAVTVAAVVFFIATLYFIFLLIKTIRSY